MGGSKAEDVFELQNGVCRIRTHCFEGAQSPLPPHSGVVRNLERGVMGQTDGLKTDRLEAVGPACREHAVVRRHAGSMPLEMITKPVKIHQILPSKGIVL